MMISREHHKYVVASVEHTWQHCLCGKTAVNGSPDATNVEASW